MFRAEESESSMTSTMLRRCRIEDGLRILSTETRELEWVLTRRFGTTFF